MPRRAWRVLPRSLPTARSGCVTRPTTWCDVPPSAANVGSAKLPVPIMTRRIVRNQESGVRSQGSGGSGVSLTPGSRLCFERRQDLFDFQVGRDFTALLGLTELLFERLDALAGG